MRIFVPVTVTTREKFRDLCGDRKMAEVLREHIEGQVAKSVRTRKLVDVARLGD